MSSTTASEHESKVIDRAIIRFAGDSGDGMQLAGDRFTEASAFAGNDLSTFPDYPAEIRAPAGTTAGVSAFQVQIFDHDILTPGDAPNVLVAMNPAALKVNLHELPPGAVVIVNSDAFDQRNLAKAEYASNPLEDGTLAHYKVYEVPITSLTLEACKPIGAKPRDAERSKNFFALGLVSWMYSRPTDVTLNWIDKKFGKDTLIGQANKLAFTAGYNFGETAELFEANYEVHAAHLSPGTYTTVSGNTALAWGIIAAGELAKRTVFLGSYPITPASDILHELSKHKEFGVKTLQAEDEIAGVGSALGAAYGGALGVTTTSGPGLDLKAETIGLAVSLELPLVVVDVQRAGPSTGMPTKTEQADLLEAMYGRHGEAQVPIVAAKSPGHCFWAAIEAARIALKYRTPVILLSDAYLANGSEPWRVPELSELPDISVPNATEPNHTDNKGTNVFWPYVRDEATLARQWALPGTPGLEHRIGGLEKEDGSGHVSYDPVNHEKMVRLRSAKIAGIVNDIPHLEVDDPPDLTSDGNGKTSGRSHADLLVLSWGSTYGSVLGAVRRVRARGHRVAHAHLVHLNPFPPNLGEVLSTYPKVLVPEINLGQLARLLRAEFLVDVRSFNKVQGIPLKVHEVEEFILGVIAEGEGMPFGNGKSVSERAVGEGRVVR